MVCILQPVSDNPKFTLECSGKILLGYHQSKHLLRITPIYIHAESKQTVSSGTETDKTRM